MPMSQQTRGTMLLQVANFGAIRLEHGQLCEAAVVGWDVEREGLALINSSAIERGSGLIGGRDSALDCPEWLGCGLGAPVSVLAGFAIQRRTLKTIEWPWLQFAAAPSDAATGELLELPWAAIRVLWITTAGLNARLAE